MQKTSSYEKGAADALEAAGIRRDTALEAASVLHALEKKAGIVDFVGENGSWLLPLLTTLGGTTLGYYSGRYGTPGRGMLGDMYDFSVGGLRSLVRKSGAPLYDIRDYLVNHKPGK